MIKVFETPQQLAQAAAQKFIDAANLAIAERGSFNVALSGGGTPMLTYQTIASNFSEKVLDWSKVHFFLGDERVVSADSDESNFKNISAALGTLPRLQIHRVQTELGAERAAEEYQRQIDGLQFDFVFLGLGEDGHIASLFPGTSALTENEKSVTVGQ